jgi:translation initiation factor IF-3
VKRYYRINKNIRAKKVRVVDDDGEQVGVFPLQEALFKARKKGLDLVEVATKAKPPVCKIIDFNKFKYEQNKKQKAGKKKKHKQETKEVRFTPFIAENDLQRRVKQAKEFLKDGDKVKLTVKFRGREITKKKFGYEIIEKAQEQLKDIALVESKPKWHGKTLVTVLRPE